MKRKEPDSDNNNIIKFNSYGNRKYVCLSNFYFSVVTIPDLDDVPKNVFESFPIFKRLDPLHAPWIFPSTEHLWQALKSKDESTWDKFCANGEWADFPKPGEYPFQKDSEAMKPRDQSFGFWKKRHCVGIIPKMATNPERVKRHGWNKYIDVSLERLSPELEEEVWIWILMKKFSNLGAPRETLIGTIGHTLLELERYSSVKYPSHWGGSVSEDDKTKIIGDNVMGNYLAQVREKLQIKT